MGLYHNFLEKSLKFFIQSIKIAFNMSISSLTKNFLLQLHHEKVLKYKHFLAHMFCTLYNDPINGKNPVLAIPDLMVTYQPGWLII